MFTGLASIPFVIINLPVLIPTLFLGYVLYSLKSLSIIRVYNKWVYLYSGVYVAHDVVVDQTKQFNSNMIIDKHILNASIFEQILLGCLPSLTIEIINNVNVLATAAPSVLFALAYLPVAVSGINVLTGLYSICYCRLYLKIKVVDMPIKVSVMNIVLLDTDSDSDSSIKYSTGDYKVDSESGILLSEVKSSLSSADLQRISDLEGRVKLLEESHQQMRSI